MPKKPAQKKSAPEPKVPGFHMPVPGHNELRPNARSANYVSPSDPAVRRFAQNKQSIMDFGAPRGSYGDPLSPASPTFVAPGPPPPIKDDDSHCLQTPTLVEP